MDVTWPLNQLLLLNPETRAKLINAVLSGCGGGDNIHRQFMLIQNLNEINLQQIYIRGLSVREWDCQFLNGVILSKF